MRLSLRGVWRIRRDASTSDIPEPASHLQILLVRSGTAQWTVDGKPWTLGRNDLLHLRPGQTRWAIGETEFSFALARFQVDRAPGEALPEWMDLPQVIRLDETAADRVAADLDEMATELQQQPLHHRDVINLTAQTMIARIHRHAMTAEVAAPDVRSGTTTAHQRQLVEDFINQVVNSPTAAVNIAAAARSLAVSSSQLRKIVRETTGLSPQQFIIRTKVRRAEALLESGSTVTEAAQAVGYDDPFYFSRLFHRVNGKSPSQWAVSRRRRLFPDAGDAFHAITDFE